MDVTAIALWPIWQIGKGLGASNAHCLESQKLAEALTLSAVVKPGAWLRLQCCY